MFIYVFIIK